MYYGSYISKHANNLCLSVVCKPDHSSKGTIHGKINKGIARKEKHMAKMLVG